MVAYEKTYEINLKRVETAHSSNQWRLKYQIMKCAKKKQKKYSIETQYFFIKRNLCIKLNYQSSWIYVSIYIFFVL